MKRKKPVPRTEDQLVEQLRVYRQAVQLAARGERLSFHQVEDARFAMHALRLPSHAWRRDVRAVLVAPRADTHRRLELALGHPHLWADAKAWAREELARRGASPKAARPPAAGTA